MRLAAVAACWFVALLALAGCAQNPMVMQGQVQTLQQQQAALTQRNQELQSRANALDQDNQELETMLAQSRQQTRVFEDQLAAVRTQLGDSASQLARLREEHSDVSKKAETMAASVKRRTGATITANNSLRDRLPPIELPGVEVRVDGDVVRLEIAASKLFEPAGARLLPQAPSMIDSIAAEVYRAYPDQLIGIEGHTGSEPLRASVWTSNQQLSVGEAMAVYDYLVARSRLKPNQLFVVGHGENHPVVSNGTPAGRERNRRVELVIYPERAATR